MIVACARAYLGEHAVEVRGATGVVVVVACERLVAVMSALVWPWTGFSLPEPARQDSDVDRCVS